MRLWPNIYYFNFFLVRSSISRSAADIIAQIKSTIGRHTCSIQYCHSPHISCLKSWMQLYVKKGAYKSIKFQEKNVFCTCPCFKIWEVRTSTFFNFSYNFTNNSAVNTYPTHSLFEDFFPKKKQWSKVVANCQKQASSFVTKQSRRVSTEYQVVFKNKTSWANGKYICLSSYKYIFLDITFWFFPFHLNISTGGLVAA